MKRVAEFSITGSVLLVKTERDFSGKDGVQYHEHNICVGSQNGTYWIDYISTKSDLGLDKGDELGIVGDLIGYEKYTDKSGDEKYTKSYRLKAKKVMKSPVVKMEGVSV